MARPEFPKTLLEFQRQFATEQACADYLFASRWPDGFRCPRCDHPAAFLIAGRAVWQCANRVCRHQVSLRSGTVFERSTTPLTTWFWAAFLVATDKRGLSATLLAQHLGVTYCWRPRCLVMFRQDWAGTERQRSMETPQPDRR